MGHKHIRKRSFPTKCRECGKPVLYWECICGAKAFFILPIYGKPQRHICEKYLVQKKTSTKKWLTPVEPKKVRESPYDAQDIENYECPICNKIFRKEDDLNAHIKELKKIDEDHKIFFDNVLDMINFDFDEEEEQTDKIDDISLKQFKKDYNAKREDEEVGFYGIRMKKKKKKT